MWEETKGTNKKQGDKQNALRGGGVKGALAHRLQRLQNPKWPPLGPKMADGVNPQVFGPYKQLLLNKFFDPSTPSMRKRKKKRGGGTDENSGHYVIASSRPPERRPLERQFGTDTH